MIAFEAGIDLAREEVWEVQTPEVVDFGRTLALLEIEGAGKLGVVEAMELVEVQEVEDRSTGNLGATSTPYYKFENKGQAVD